MCKKSTEFIKDRIAKAGIGFCPEAMAAPAIAAGDVCRIPLRQYIPERSVCLIEDSSRPQSVAMRALKDLLCADAGGRQAPLECAPAPI